MSLIDRRQLAAALGFTPFFLAGCARAPGERAALLSARFREWEANIPRWLKETKLPGVSLLVIDNGKILWHGAYGLKDARLREPVTQDTVFAACSNTKPVFAYAVLKLAEHGVMRLDTPLTSYTSKRFTDDPQLELITARHVLSHSTGFPNWRSGKEPPMIQFKPGSRYQYSEEGYHYLQSVVEELTGQPFAAFMRANILEPFRMTASRFVWDDYYARRMARPHNQDGNPIAKPGATAAQQAADLEIHGAAAGLHTTAGDYAKFLLEILDPKPADSFRLGASSLREYLRPQIKRSELASSSLGWIVGGLNGATIFTHAGSAPGWNCDCAASPNRKAGFVVMANGDNFLPFREKLKLDMDFYKVFFAA